MSKKHEPGMAFDIKKLNKIFAFLSIIFLITVVWVFLDDFIRPWKGVQIKAMQIKREKLLKKLEKANKAVDANKIKGLEEKLEDAHKIVAARKTDISGVDAQVKAIKIKIKSETIINGTLNSQVAALTFDYGVAHAEHLPNAHDLFVKLRKTKKLFEESKDRNKNFTGIFKSLKKKGEALTKEVSTAEKSIKAMTNTRELLKMAISKTDMGPIFAARNSPMVDYLDPTLKIEQIVLENITDDRYFRHVPKVDRCITCHTFINEAGFEDQKNPFKSHPNLALILGEKSPHPMKKIGCTVCHGGEGHRVNDFNSAAHTPQNKKQEKEWVEEYHWHAPHKVPQVMLKKGMVEASCIKCHKGVEFVSQAPILNKGRQNIEKFGCYGCHKIEGFEHKRKPGPSLEKIASKVTKEFFKNWVWNPKSFNKHAKMPRFFNQDNNSTPEFMKKNIAEVNAMAEYIWSLSRPYKPFAKYAGGNSSRGKDLVSSVGCMGCHGVEGFEDEWKKTGAFAGTFLTGTGTKLDADWLVSWLKKPDHYDENTIMPSFRLSDREANDIAAYFLSLKNESFEKLAFENIDKEARDEILISYFSAFDTLKVANKKLEAMSDNQRTLELGHRSVGKYGCYSCHSIKGFDGRAPIGPELSKVGSKPLTQFGFGHEHDVEHSRDGWIVAHLQNPRRWDNGADKPFKDLLRMPHFDMSEEDAHLTTVALLGLVSDYIPLAGVKQMSADERYAAEGMKVVNKFNCNGCHVIDGERGDILAIYDDVNEGPPMLMEEGHRVQADWFHYFLDNVYPIRPWLSVRMPSFNFTNEERNAIVGMFQHKAHQETFVDLENAVNWEPGERAAAKALFKELDCATCHTSGFNNDEATAPNLYMAKRRLRPSWVSKWLSNPQSILEDTVMPNFWEDGESQAPDILGGDSKKQIQALTKYIFEIGTDELPTKNTKFWSKQ
jgi:mono/diheme cytochrome c family protein